MSDRSKAFWVGLFGLGTAVTAGVLILWNSDFSVLPFRAQYELQLRVPQAPGVAPDTPVRRRGILIGRVADVEATDEGALITLNIDEGQVVKTNELPRIQTSMMGDAIVEFVQVRPAEGAQPVAPGGPPVEGVYNPNPVDMLSELQGDLRNTILALGRAGDEVAELADRLNTVLGDQDMDRIGNLVKNLEVAIERFGNVMGDVEELVGDETLKEDIRQGFAQLPTVLSDARAVFEALEKTAASAEQNLKNLQGLTGPLGERGDQIVVVIEDTISSLDELFAGAAELVGNINQSEGTIGRLLNDRTLSDQAEATLKNANMAVLQLRDVIGNINVVIKRLRPILDDVTVIADKVARDPARIARGVLKRETPVGDNVNSYRRPPFLFER